MTGKLDAMDIGNFSFEGDPNEWRATVHVKKKGALEAIPPEVVPLTGSLEDLENYDVEIVSLPPTLNINDSASCESFKERVKVWVSHIKLTSPQFLFKGKFEGTVIEYHHSHPAYPSFSLQLETLSMERVPQEGKIIVDKFFGITESKTLIDLKEWTPESFRTYEFLKSRVEEAKPNRISTKFGCPACELMGRMVYYKIPPLSGIFDPKDYEREIPWSESSASTSLYKKSLAARVWRAKEREQHKAGIFIFPKQFQGGESELGAGESASSQSDGESASFQSDGESLGHQSLGSGLVLEEDSSLYLYTLIGPETPIESPFIYSDGEDLFLTKTYEQPCREENPREASSADHFFLTYTAQTPFKIIAESSDLRLTRGSSKFERGLYVLKGGNWCLLENNYKPKNKSAKYKARKIDLDTLSREAQEIQKAKFPEMAEVYRYLGEMAGFIKTHPKTLEDDAKFREYHGLIYSQGLLKTMTSIPPEHENLIVPLLLTVRENPGLNDPKLWKSEAVMIEGEGKISQSGPWMPADVAWALQSHGPKTFSEFISRHYNSGGSEIFGICNLDSLRCLPLLKTKEISLWIPEHEGKYDRPRIFTEKNYKEFARFILMNQLNGLFFSGFLYSSQLTIKPFADALREQTSISQLILHEKSKNLGGLEDIQYLLLNGIAQSSSIKEFHWYRFMGDQIYSLIGEMIARNKSISSAIFRSLLPNDLEALNRLGKGFEKNKSIKKLRFNFYDYVYRYDECFSYPLPDRPLGTGTIDLSDFTRGIINNTSLTELEFEGLNPHSKSHPGYSSLIKAIKEIKRPGLKIILHYLEGSKKNEVIPGASPYDEWEG